ncbi:MAG: sulfotransferase family 2 domain-containing protein [Patescibacteria group bacterium]
MALLLPHSIFFHIPKTGGSWVRSAVSNAGIPVNEIIKVPAKKHLSAGTLMHTCPTDVHLTDRFRFAFVRHPLTRYQSYWCFRMLHGWDSELQIDRICQNDNFEKFVWAVLTEAPEGWVTRNYCKFLGNDFRFLDFVGRMENLADDLVTALTLAGESFDEQALRATPPLNVSSVLPEWQVRCSYSPDLRAAVCKAEWRVMEHFGYEENEEEAPQVAGTVMSKRTRSIT